MVSSIPRLPHPLEVERHVPAFASVKERRNPAVNVWFFDSPKNGKRFVIHGDLAFVHFVILEGEASVVAYDPNPAPVSGLVAGQRVELTPGGYVFYSNGKTEWCDFKYRKRRKRTKIGEPAESDAAKELAAQLGYEYKVFTVENLAPRAILFDNWLNLCAGISRCRSILLQREMDLIRETVLRAPVTLGALLDAPNTDRACMFAAVGLALQKGVLKADLERALFGIDSVLARALP